MKSGKTPAPAGGKAASSAAIATLLETGELPGTLGHAAVLDALPAQIAVLDARGVITSVNESWRQGAGTQASLRPGHEVGLNYLEICDNIPGAGSIEARQAAAGIRSVLSGKASGYSMEYATHVPADPQWFLLTVSSARGSAIVMHIDITERERDRRELGHLHAATRHMTEAIHLVERKRGEEALLRFGAAMDATADAIYMIDRATMSFVHVNDAACRMLHKARDVLLGLEPWTVLSTPRAELEDTYDRLIAGGTGAKPVELLRRRKDGSQVWVELRRHAHRVGDRWTIVTLVRDVTERRAVDSRIIRLNRVYAVLSGINSLIVRVRNRDELFREACQIAVELGGFRMAWIGVVDRARMMLVPLASAGTEPKSSTPVPEGASARDEVPLDGGSRTARAVREKKPVVVDEIAGDTTVVLASERTARGIHSMAILPLLVAGEAAGVLVLYAGESGFFDAEEMKLLDELAGDIAFAIDSIAKQERLDYVAYFDLLTGLANRALFHERVEQAVSNATEQHRKLALVLLDIERFKTINDTLGRKAGDALLKDVAARLSLYVVDTGRLARIDADHFAILVTDLQSIGEIVHRIEQRFAEIFGPAFVSGDSQLRLSAKLGIAMFPEDGRNAETLFRNAEAALKNAKRAGQRYLFYTQSMNERAAEKLALENELRQAIDREQFVLYYQPKVSLATGAVTGAEALIRWNHPHRGLVAPGKFIPVLEETGMIFEVGRWALRKAVEDHLRWRATGLAAVRIAVNVSPLQLRNRDFIGEVREAIGIDAHAAAGLELEITESLIMENVRNTSASLGIIRALGVSIAIDDFGTGFSSLSYLAKLPVDTLKIDRSFVIDMTTGTGGLALVSAIVNLAHALKLNVVAEGVETEEQARLLRVLNCDEMQGFLHSKPLPSEVFEADYLRPQSPG